jgi:BirA family biotin operon repressor/biotin-[acetyl-CoA-carboxylase] ligase
MDTLNATLVRDALTTSIVGRPIHYWATIGSTMDEARRLAEEDAPEGTVVIADEQTAGRGRLTMICSLAVCDAIAEVAGLRARVKWPNDVLIDERKVCGILTEMDLLGERVRYAIVGIGINVNVSFQDVPLLMTSATSLAAESGRPVSRLDLLVALLAGIERRYLALCEGQAFHQEWAKRMATLGHPVQVAGSAERWDGLAIGVDEDGALLVRGEDGCVRRVLAGDVTLRPASR